MSTSAVNVGGVLASPIAQSYNTFAGADIRATIGQFQFGELQAISYNITREKAPIYTLGSADPRSFSRNKRGIAGSLVWINFDRHALLNIIYRAAGTFVAWKDDVRPQYSSGQVLSQSAIYNSTLVRDISGLTAASTINQIDDIVTDTVSGLKELAAPWYSDQILPFDVTLAATNEIGAACTSRIYGIEILNEGWGTSIDDIVNEMQATFVARSVEPWTVVQSPFQVNPGTETVG